MSWYFLNPPQVFFSISSYFFKASLRVQEAPQHQTLWTDERVSVHWLFIFLVPQRHIAGERLTISLKLWEYDSRSDGCGLTSRWICIIYVWLFNCIHYFQAGFLSAMFRYRTSHHGSGFDLPPATRFAFHLGIRIWIQLLEVTKRDRRKNKYFCITSIYYGKRFNSCGSVLRLFPQYGSAVLSADTKSWVQ